MSYSRLKAVDFGPAKGGLLSVRYTLNNGATWTTTGITESGVQSGFYSAMVTFSDGFTGLLTWDSQGSSPARASEEINPGMDENSGLIAAGEAGVSCRAVVQVGSTVSVLILVASSGFTLSPVPGDYEGRLVKIVSSTAAGRIGCDATAGGWDPTTNTLGLSRPFKAAPLPGDVVGFY